MKQCTIAMTDTVDEALVTEVTLKVARSLNLDMNNRTLGRRIIGVAKITPNVEAFKESKHHSFAYYLYNSKLHNHSQHSNQRIGQSAFYMHYLCTIHCAVMLVHYIHPTTTHYEPAFLYTIQLLNHCTPAHFSLQRVKNMVSSMNQQLKLYTPRCMRNPPPPPRNPLPPSQRNRRRHCNPRSPRGAFSSKRKPRYQIVD